MRCTYEKTQRISLIMLIKQSLIIAQSIVRAQEFWGTALRTTMITDSVSHTVCYYGLGKWKFDSNE